MTSQNERAPLYLNDDATLEDRHDFGMASAGDQLARLVLDVETPFTVGVTGKWGAGKTSVLRRAFASLAGQQVEVEVPFAEPKKEEDEVAWNALSFEAEHRERALDFEAHHLERAHKTVAVWFSPWQHQAAADPLVPLLLEIRRQYGLKAKKLEDRLRQKLKKKFRGSEVRRGVLAGMALLERVVDGALVLSGGGKVATGTTEAVVKGWGESQQPGLDDGQRFQLLFQDAVETALEGLPAVRGASEEKGRLVVFVDDLDRCEERVVVELLEAIKIYLGSPRCVFVLGIDEAAVLGALGRHWTGRSLDSNREYLEKLFQAVVPIPMPAPDKMRARVEGLLAEHGFEKPGPCAELIIELIEPNPRKVKNFVNAVCAVRRLFGVEKDPPAGHPELRLVLFHYLRVHHRAIWRLLERQRWTLRLLHKVVNRSAELGIELGEGIELSDQKLMEEMMLREFAHVLGERRPSEAGKRRTHYHSLAIDDAVHLLLDRLDRKRSDELFVVRFKQQVESGEDLPEVYLLAAETETATGGER